MTDKKRVVIITTSYPIPGEPEGAAAAGNFIKDFVEELDHHVETHIIAPGSEPKLGDRISTYYTPPGRALSTLSIKSPRDLLTILRVIWSGCVISRKVAQQLDHIDHVLACWVLPCGLWANIIARKKDSHYSVWALGSDIWQFKKILPLRMFLRHTIRQATGIFADGLELANEVSEIGKVQCTFMPSTRSIEQVSNKTLSAPYSLTYLARWHPNKGIDLLCTALKGLSSEAWQQIGKVTIAGDGPLRPEIEKEIADLRKEGRPIETPGYVAKEAVEQLLHQTDFLLIPSRIESIPVVFSDAMAAMCPVITMPVGDLPELVRRYECGLVASEVTAAAFRAAIEQSLTIGFSVPKSKIHIAQDDFNQKTIVSKFISYLS